MKTPSPPMKAHSGAFQRANASPRGERVAVPGRKSSPWSHGSIAEHPQARWLRQLSET